MHGSGIIDHGRDTLLFETGLERIAFFLAVQADSVLRPARIVAFGNDRGLYLAAQLAGVEGGGFVDVPQLVFAKSFEFYFQDSGLQGIQREFMPIRTLSYLNMPLPCTVRICQRSPFVVVGKHRSAVAVTAKAGGEKEVVEMSPKLHARFVAYHTPKSLRTVLENEKPVASAILRIAG